MKKAKPNKLHKVRGSVVDTRTNEVFSFGWPLLCLFFSFIGVMIATIEVSWGQPLVVDAAAAVAILFYLVAIHLCMVHVRSLPPSGKLERRFVVVSITSISTGLAAVAKAGFVSGKQDMMAQAFGVLAVALAIAAAVAFGFAIWALVAKPTQLNRTGK